MPRANGTGRLVAPVVKRHGDARRGKPASEHLGPIDEHERTAAPAGEHTNMDAGARKPRICPPTIASSLEALCPVAVEGAKSPGTLNRQAGFMPTSVGEQCLTMACSSPSLSSVMRIPSRLSATVNLRCQA